MNELNDLEKALIAGNDALNTYLEIESTEQIRADIEQIKRKAALSTPAGQLHSKMQEVLNSFHAIDALMY